MSRNFQTIKALRENFLKRHQVDKDFFTLPAQQEHSLTDEALFSPSDYLQPILHHQRHTQTVMRDSSIPLYLRNKGTSSDFQSASLKINYEKKGESSSLKQPIRKPLIKMPLFVKTERGKKKVHQYKHFAFKTGSQAQFSTKAASLVKPCDVQTARIRCRSESNIVAIKKKTSANQEPKRNKQKNVKKRTKTNDILPWDTDTKDYCYHC